MGDNQELNQRFWIVKSTRASDSMGLVKPKVSVHTWQPGEDLSDPIWKSRKIPFQRSNPVKMAEYPNHVLPIWTGGGDCYLGLNNGSIHKIIASDDKKNRWVETFPSRFSDYNCLRGRVRDNEEHLITQGWRKIRSLVNFDKGVYDASLAGLFETETGKQIDGRRISSAVVYDGKLCIVPTHPPMSERKDGAESYRRYNSGDLVDALTDNIILERLTPFDGSGCSQADYLIQGSRAYVHHGNSSSEVTIRDIPTGEVIRHDVVPNIQRFVAHNNIVYDIRDGQEERGYTLVQTEAPDKKDLSYKVPKNCISVASGGKRGIIFSSYDYKKDRTKIVSHLNVNETLYEGEGHLRLHSYGGRR